MTGPNPSDENSGENRPKDHESVANDRFMHGLLEHLHRDTDATRERRIASVFARLGDSQATPRRLHHRLFTRIIPLATAAVIALVVVAGVVFMPQSAAYAMIGQAIKATQLASQLRYEIKLTDSARHIGPESDIGVLDMRGDFLRVQIETPQGHDFVLGRDRLGEWSLRQDGSVERFHPRAAAPRWINLGESTILVGGLDALLDELRDGDYSVERIVTDPTAPPEGGLTLLEATRRQGVSRPGPDRIRVWIDAATSLVERLELHWTRRSEARSGQGADRESDRARGERHRPAAPPRGGPPELLGDRPRFSDHDHPPPPELIVFQRAPAVDLPDERFSPPGP